MVDIIWSFGWPHSSWRILWSPRTAIGRQHKDGLSPRAQLWRNTFFRFYISRECEIVSTPILSLQTDYKCLIHSGPPNGEQDRPWLHLCQQVSLFHTIGPQHHLLPIGHIPGQDLVGGTGQEELPVLSCPEVKMGSTGDYF